LGHGVIIGPGRIYWVTARGRTHSAAPPLAALSSVKGARGGSAGVPHGEDASLHASPPLPSLVAYPPLSVNPTPLAWSWASRIPRRSVLQQRTSTRLVTRGGQAPTHGRRWAEAHAQVRGGGGGAVLLLHAAGGHAQERRRGLPLQLAPGAH
jgi:hypothetical protein